MTPSKNDAAQPTVLFVSTPPALGGSNRSLINILDQLEGRATRVVAAPLGSFMDLARESELAEEYIILPRIPPRRVVDRLLRVYGGLKICWWAIRNNGRLAAIHANALSGLTLSTLAAFVTRKPTLVWIHDPVGTDWGARLGPIVRRLLPRLRIAAVSRIAEGVAVENGLCDPGSATIVPNPIDPAEICAVDRRETPDPLHVGYVGGASLRKGFDLLPDVVEATLDLPIVWKLYVFLRVNEGTETAWERLKAFGRDRVDPVGKLADVRRVYGDLDIVFIPSRAESFCRVAAEAMLNKLPVVGSDIDPLRALLGDDEAGLIFPNENVAEAVAAVRKVVADPELRAKLGERGEERAARFSPAAITNELTRLYGLD